MIKKTFFLIFFSAIFIKAESQHISRNNIPTHVIDAFSLAYPTILDVEWYKDSIYYKAKFFVKSVSNSVTYERNGNMISTRTEIAVESLSTCIVYNAHRKYPEDKIKKAYRIVKRNNVIIYEIQVRKVVMKYDAACMLLKEEKIQL